MDCSRKTSLLVSTTYRRYIPTHDLELGIESRKIGGLGDIEVSLASIERAEPEHITISNMRRLSCS